MQDRSCLALSILGYIYVIIRYDLGNSQYILWLTNPDMDFSTSSEEGKKLVFFFSSETFQMRFKDAYFLP